MTGPVVFAALKELFFPFHCAACGEGHGNADDDASVIDAAAIDSGVCAACLSRLELYGPQRCPSCSRPCSGGLCRVCRQFPPTWRRLIVLGPYAGVLGQLVRAGKFAQRHDVLEILVPELLRRLDGVAYDTVCAIPSDHGFSAALADALADQLDAARLDLVVRVPGALRQGGLKRRERLTNAHSAFTRRDVSAPQAVLLVDDVVTTGATLAAAATLVTSAGAILVDAAVLARTPIAPRSERAK